jgi:hypothetical protein
MESFFSRNESKPFAQRAGEPAALRLTVRVFAASNEQQSPPWIGEHYREAGNHTAWHGRETRR